MAQARDEAGNIWEVDAQGNPVRLVTPAGAPTKGRVLTLPQSAKDARQEARQAEADARAAAAADRAARAADRAAGADERTGTNMGINNTMQLAQSYNSDPGVKAYRVAIGQFGQALNTGEGPQADLALTYAFAKAMDPESVVRESEQGMVTSAQPWFKSTVERVKKEFGMDGAGNFTPEARDALRAQIANSVAQRQRIYDARRQYFEKQAQTFGVDPAIIVGEHDKSPFLDDIDKFTKRVHATEQARQPDTPAAPGVEPLALTVTDDGTYEDSYLGQGLSGINEGIANTLGAPVDLAAGALNLIPRTVNFLADTDIPTIDSPLLGSQWWKDSGLGWSINPQTDDPGKQFVRRASESVGGSIIPGAAAGNLGKGALALTSGLGGGVGAATAQQVFPGNPYAEFLAEVVGSAGGGMGALKANQRGAQRQIEAAIPTVDELKAQAGDMYRQAEARGVTADPAQTQNLADILRQTLRGEGKIAPDGRINEVYPRAKEAVLMADSYAGNVMTPRQLQTVRSVMTDTGRSADATERRLGALLTEEFDDWAAPIAPELPAAREVASRYLNAEKLEQARELAQVEASKFTGSGLENALRTQYRGLDRNAVKGRDVLPPALNDAIERVSRGTPASNIARGLGRLAPTGPVSFGAGSMLPAIGAGALTGSPMTGGAVGLGMTALGTGGRMAAERMGLRAADVAELIARNGGPIDQAPLIPDAFGDYAARLAAIQQAKYLAERRQDNPPK